MRKPTGPWRWIAAAGFGLLLWSFCVVSIVRATKKLTDLAKITAMLDSVSVEQGGGRSKPYYVVFNLKNTSKRLGIFNGADELAAKQLASQFREGAELTIYYDATGPTVERKVNLFTYQVQDRKRIIFTLADAQRRNWHLALLFGALACVFTSVFSVLFYKEFINSQPVA